MKRSLLFAIPIILLLALAACKTVPRGGYYPWPEAREPYTPPKAPPRIAQSSELVELHRQGFARVGIVAAYSLANTEADRDSALLAEGKANGVAVLMIATDRRHQLSGRSTPVFTSSTKTTGSYGNVIERTTTTQYSHTETKLSDVYYSVAHAYKHDPVLAKQQLDRIMAEDRADRVQYEIYRAVDAGDVARFRKLCSAGVRLRSTLVHPEWDNRARNAKVHDGIGTLIPILRSPLGIAAARGQSEIFSALAATMRGKPWFLDARKWEEDPATRYSLRYWEERKAEPPSDPFQSDYDRFATLLDIIESDRLDMLKALLDNGYPAEEIRSAKLRQPVGGYRAYSDPPYMFAENNDPQVKGWVFLQPVQRARRYGAKRILAYLASRPDCKGMFEDAERAPWNEATPAPVGSEALIAAIEGGKNGEVARLLDGKLDPNSAGSRGRTPLTLSASLGRNEVQERTVTLLLLRGADPDRADASGNLPLHLAARSGNSNMVESLLKSGAKVNRADGAGFVPYQYATTGAMEEQLRKAGAVAVPGKAPSGNR